MSDKAVFEVETQFSSKGAAKALGDLNRYKSNLADIQKKTSAGIPNLAGSRPAHPAPPRRGIESIRGPGLRSIPATHGSNQRFQDIISGKTGGGFIDDIIGGHGLLGRFAQMGAAIMAVEAATSALGAAFGFVKFSVESVVGAVFQLSSALVSTMAHFFDFAQRSKLAFSSLLDDSVAGSQVFDSVRHMAQDLGLEVEGTVDSYRKLLAAQFSVQDATNLTKATADLQALGASTDDVKHALLAISQIKMKGKLQAEELTRQLANAGVSTELVYQEIEKSLFGKHDKETRKKVLAMQQGGEISADVAIPAIMEAIKRKAHESELGEVSLKFANEKVGGMLQQTVGMFKNFFTDIAGDIEEPITNVAKTIFKTIKEVASSPLIQNLRERLGNAFVSVAEFVKKTWPQVMPFVVGAIMAITQALQNMTAFMTDNGDMIRQKLATIGVIAFGVAQIMVGVTSIVFTLTGAFISLAETLERIANNPLSKFLINAAGGLISAIPGFGVAGTLAANTITGTGAFMGGARSSLSSLGQLGQGALAGSLASSEGEGQLGGLLAGIDARRTGISPLGDSVTQKSIGTINNTINVTPLDPDDPNGLGGVIADAVNRKVTNALDEGS